MGAVGAGDFVVIEEFAPDRDDIHKAQAAGGIPGEERRLVRSERVEGAQVEGLEAAATGIAVGELLLDAGEKALVGADLDIRFLNDARSYGARARMDF